MPVDRTVFEHAALLLESEYDLPVKKELATILDTEENEGAPRDLSIILSTMTGSVLAQALVHVGKRFYAILNELGPDLAESDKIKLVTQRLHEEFVAPANKSGATLHGVILAFIKSYSEKKRKD